MSMSAGHALNRQPPPSVAAAALKLIARPDGKRRHLADAVAARPGHKRFHTAKVSEKFIEGPARPPTGYPLSRRALAYPHSVRRGRWRRPLVAMAVRCRLGIGTQCFAWIESAGFYWARGSGETGSKESPARLFANLR